MSFKDKILKNQSPWGAPPGGDGSRNSPGGNGSGSRQDPPSIDDLIEVISISAVNTAGCPVTSVNGEVGAVTVASKHNVSVINTGTTAVANTLYVFTANLNLTLPASPAMGDSIKISNRSGVATCQLLKNGDNMNLAIPLF